MQTDSDHHSADDHFSDDHLSGSAFLTRLLLLVVVAWLFFAALPLLFPFWWLGDLIANLRVQLVLAGLGVLVALLIKRSWKVLAVVIVACVYHSSWFVMTGPIAAADPSVPASITVMAANVYTGNTNYKEIERLFRESQADVIVVPELSFGLGLALNESFTQDYPYLVEFPGDRGNFGMGVYSKLPLQNASVEFLNGDTIPTIVCDIEADGHTVHIVGIHTLPPMGKRAFEHRNQHLKTVADLIQRKKDASPETAVIVLGDFNLTPWSPVFHKLLDDANLNQTVQGNRLQPTWYRWPAFPFGLVLDHVLLSDNLQCVTRSIGPSAGSDHRFVTVEASFRQ